MTTKNTILRVRLYGGTYTAADVADPKRKVSCTMGDHAAANAWATKFAPAAPLADVCQASRFELNGVDRSKDKSSQYVTYWSIPAPDKGPVVTHLAIEQLYLHPSLERIALVPDASAALLGSHHGDQGRQERGQELAEDWAAWVEEIRQNGVREPLRVIRRPVGEADCRPLPGYWVIDGRHRFTGAAQAGKTVLPCIVVEETDANALAAGSVIGRRHWTKSQRAWFAVILHPEVAAEDRKTGRPAKSRTECGVSNGDLASRFGVSLRLIEQAVELYRGLEAYPDFKVRIEPSIWGGAGLGDLVNGLNALISGSTGPGISHPKLPTARFAGAWKHEAAAAAAKWKSLTDDQRIVLTNDLKAAAKDLPADYLDWKLDILADILAEKRKAEAEEAAAAVPAPLSEA